VVIATGRARGLTAHDPFPLPQSKTAQADGQKEKGKREEREERKKVCVFECVSDREI